MRRPKFAWVAFDCKACSWINHFYNVEACIAYISCLALYQDIGLCDEMTESTTLLSSILRRRARCYVIVQYKWYVIDRNKKCLEKVGLVLCTAHSFSFMNLAYLLVTDSFGSFITFRTWISYQLSETTFGAPRKRTIIDLVRHVVTANTICIP